MVRREPPQVRVVRRRRVHGEGAMLFVRWRNVSRVGEARPSSGVSEAPVSGELEARSGELGLLVRLRRLPGLRCPRRGLDHHYHQHRLPIPPPFAIPIPSPPTKPVTPSRSSFEASACKTLGIPSKPAPRQRSAIAARLDVAVCFELYWTHTSRARRAVGALVSTVHTKWCKAAVVSQERGARTRQLRKKDSTNGQVHHRRRVG